MAAKDQDPCTQTFQYQPIGPDHIRVLFLEPAITRFAAIRCALVSVPFAELRSVTALSYTWGTDAKTCSIFLNDVEVSVTGNLESALRQIRGRFKTRKVWADAVCIDQDNVTERSEQVKLMRQIYSTAEQVFAWLGLASKDSGAAIEFIKKLNRKSDEGSGISDDGFRKWLLGTVADGDTWSAVTNLMSRPYWTRVWIIQELSLAKTHVSIHCGPDEITLNAIRALKQSVSNGSREINQVSDNMNIDFVFGQLYAKFLHTGYFASSARAEKNLADRGAATLWDLVNAYRGHETTDPRDHIYGLQGLIADRNSPDLIAFPPDYSVSVEALYTTFVAHNLGRVDLGSLLESCNEVKRRAGLPSWVPDFSTKPRSFPTSGWAVSPDNIFKASGHQAGEYHISDNGDTLSVKGAVVDMIRSARLVAGMVQLDPTDSISLSLYDDEQGGAEEDRLELGPDGEGRQVPLFVTNDLFLLDESNHAMQEPYIGGSTLLSAYLCATVAIASSTHWAARTGEVSADICIDSETQENAQWTKNERRCWFSVGKRLCTCENGWICMAQPDTRPGDLICVISGVDVPFVIRRADQVDCFTLVGDAYVHGLMQGEILTRSEGYNFKHICLV
ncbi:HET domain containing protein [Hyaloscypha variabilis]